ncbi:MAG: 16S rRNA (uracil(1498)-N(3))-methyltransferase [Puniceicoccales bacterium]|jgi:16S rRNA (uracil1498-N3)-methyltransferase|nr:16S rRNA (uracil(1498)-N(3))-methyltransferase [Puniceicoccales bacterium]
MTILRAYHPLPVPPAATEITLAPAESAHLTRSLRARAGEVVHAFDGHGRLWRGTVARADAAGLVMRVEAEEKARPPAPALLLALALPKGGLFDDILRAAVEIGTAGVFPLLTERCETRLDAQRAAARLARWNTIAVEACKQSGNLFLPQIAPPADFRTWLKTLPAAVPAGTLLLTGSLEDGAPPLAKFFGTDADAGAPPAAHFPALLMLIGPEGDLTPAEHALAREHGFHGVRFGENVLRVPTAALYALAALDQARRR